MKKHIGIALLFTAACSLSFLLGTRVGLEQAALGSAQLSLMRHYATLKALERSPSEARSLGLAFLESDLVTHSYWKESPWQWLFPEFKVENDKYARKAAGYRLTHPDSDTHTNNSPYSDRLKQILNQYRDGA